MKVPSFLPWTIWSVEFRESLKLETPVPICLRRMAPSQNKVLGESPPMVEFFIIMKVRNGVKVYIWKVKWVGSTGHNTVIKNVCWVNSFPDMLHSRVIRWVVPLSNLPSSCVPKFMLWRIWSDKTVDCAIDQVSVLININLKIDTQHWCCHEHYYVMFCKCIAFRTALNCVFKVYYAIQLYVVVIVLISKKKHIAWKHGFIYNIPNFLIDHAPFIIPVEDTNDIFVFLWKCEVVSNCQSRIENLLVLLVRILT